MCLALVAGLSLALSGCAAQMMQSSGESQYAPMNERNGGQVRYLAAGIPPVQRSRREDAYKQMYERCNGRYRIISENSESAGAIVHPVGGAAMVQQGSWRYIDFECEQ
jgi:hypothetical protein